MNQKPNSHVNILIIEDARSVSEVLKSLINENSNGKTNVLIAETLSEGLSMLISSGFEILILDLNLPDSSVHSTIEWISKIKERFPKLLIIVMSGFASEANKNAAISHGATAFLEKPIQSVAEIVKHVCEISEIKKRTERIHSSVNELRRLVTSLI